MERVVVRMVALAEGSSAVGGLDSCRDQMPAGALVEGTIFAVEAKVREG